MRNFNYGFGLNGFAALKTLKINRSANLLLSFTAALALAGSACAQQSSGGIVLDRSDRTIVVEPWAENIVRITLSTSRPDALAAPGYGFVGSPQASGWTHTKDSDGGDLIRSGSMQVRIAPQSAPAPHGLQLDALNQSLREIYFGGGGGPAHGPWNDLISIESSSGKPLLKLWRWSMQPNQPADVPGSTSGANGPGYRISATFDSPQGEHYYGLGQQQQGFLDLRDHHIQCWHNYDAVGGENVCVPFMVSSRGYGLVWDNPSKTSIDLGFNQKNIWSSDVGDRISFFVIAGDQTDDLYQGYRSLTGVTHLLPKAAYGYIQSKAIYPTEDQALEVAKGYRDRQLPLDVLVVDFLNMTRQGEMDLDPARWPDPAAMNSKLHAMGISTMLSVWPHYSVGTQFYDTLLKNGWLVHTPDGKPDSGWTKDVIGPNLDTTNPEAARWFWEKIRDRYVKPFGFDSIWLDETEPDIDAAKDVFSIGSGTRYFNLYPLFHTSSVYEGSRRDFGDSRRVMILARAAYLGAQRNDTVFWSSDIYSTWDMLKRSIPAGLNFTASGMAYWDTDIAGFFSPTLHAGYHAAKTPLLDGSDARENIGDYEDYPELFVRWFQWGVFQPVMRAHGERMHNEVWAYGKQAEPILEKYLRLRYQLIPYTYAQAWRTYQSGAPFMRALFMDFPNDAQVADIRDEYMYGPAFLVAPITEQGATSRMVYLPAGCDWYNFWTNEKLHGGQTVSVHAPIDTIPLFVRAGSIVPLGSAVLSTQQTQKIASLRVYPGADADFSLFSDDGTSYAYEHGAGSVTRIHWDNAKQQLTHTGAAAWAEPDSSIVEIIH
ncbi:MAG: TIM-barrel domain-containing protein [Terracidiphilus sp.]